MGDNNSPILLTNVPQPIATFNRPFAPSELVGNLDGVMYLYNGSAVTVSCISYEETGQTKYALAYSGQNRIAELTVEGNTLLCSTSNTGNYLFDLDFKHQNRKFWPSPLNEVVGITCPSLVLSHDRYLICKNVQSASIKEIRLQVVNGLPLTVDAGGSIAGTSWFVNGAATHVADLVQLILQLEYDEANAGEITVTTANDSVRGTNGTWDFFTNGAPFIPLRIVSRFPNGCPILAQTIGSSTPVCTFNREPNAVELKKLVIYTGIGEGILEFASVLGQLAYFDGQSVEVAMRINGTTVSIDTTEGDAVDIYDIDYDHQFRRVPPSGLAKMNVQIPQLLDNPSAGQGFGIIHEEEVPENFGVFAAQDNAPYIVEGNTLSSEKGEWANSLQWSVVKSLLEAIVAIEFEGFDDHQPSVNPTQYRESLASGFTVTPLIPQSLS